VAAARKTRKTPTLERRRFGGTQRPYFFIAAVAVVEMAASVLFFYPGLVTNDSVLQYSEAVTGRFTTRHPPLMAEVWRLLVPLDHGPLPMLVLIQLLYWGSFVALAVYCVRRAHRLTAIIATLAGLWPLLLNFSGTIWKDVVLAAAWGLGCALLMLATQDRRRKLRFGLLSCASGSLLMLGAAMRHNAAPAAIVLALALSLVVAVGRLERILTFVCLSACAALAVPVSIKLLKAHDTQPVANIVSGDLVGISFFSGHNYRPDLSSGPYADLRCYTPRLSDACPIVGFTSDAEALARWIDTIEREPLPYLEHRSLVFSMLLRFGCRECQPAIAPPGFGASRYAMRRAFAATMVGIGRTPLGRPYVWLTAAIGLAVLLWRRDRTPEGAALSLIPVSGVVYALSFYPSAPTDEFRYVYWPIYSVVLAGTIYLLTMKVVWRDLIRWIMVPVICTVLLDLAVQTAAPTDHIAPSMQTNY
jgi:hypothetical protein